MLIRIKNVVNGALKIAVDATESGSLAMVFLVLRHRLARAFGRENPREREPAPPPVPASQRSWPTLPGPGSGKRIPNTIFQTWDEPRRGGQAGRQLLPANYQYWSDSFDLHNPTHTHLIWSDADNRDFITSEFSWFLPQYNAYPKEILRVDIVRLFFLFRFGGFYSDMDTECLQPLNASLARGDVVLGRMGRDRAFPHSIPNAMMASKPGQMFWLLAIAIAVDRARRYTSSGELSDRRPEELSGPDLIFSTYNRYRSLGPAGVREYVLQILELPALVDRASHGELKLLPSVVWYPLNWRNSWHQLFRREIVDRQVLLPREQTRNLFPRSHLVTYWTHSW